MLSVGLDSQFECTSQESTSLAGQGFGDPYHGWIACGQGGSEHQDTNVLVLIMHSVVTSKSLQHLCLPLTELLYARLTV